MSIHTSERETVGRDFACVSEFEHLTGKCRSSWTLSFFTDIGSTDEESASLSSVVGEGLDKLGGIEGIVTMTILIVTLSSEDYVHHSVGTELCR